MILLLFAEIFHTFVIPHSQ